MPATFALPAASVHVARALPASRDAARAIAECTLARHAPPMDYCPGPKTRSSHAINLLRYVRSCPRCAPRIRGGLGATAGSSVADSRNCPDSDVFSWHGPMNCQDHTAFRLRVAILGRRCTSRKYHRVVSALPQARPRRSHSAPLSGPPQRPQIASGSRGTRFRTL